jgi:hypothetical protein
VPPRRCRPVVRQPWQPELADDHRYRAHASHHVISLDTIMMASLCGLRLGLWTLSPSSRGDRRCPTRSVTAAAGVASVYDAEAVRALWGRGCGAVPARTAAHVQLGLALPALRLRANGGGVGVSVGRSLDGDSRGRGHRRVRLRIRRRFRAARITRPPSSWTPSRTSCLSRRQAFSRTLDMEGWHEAERRQDRT